MPKLRKNKILGVLAIVVFLLIAGTVVSFADTTMTPYLQAVKTNSVYVLVECNSTSPATVEYGTTTSYGSTATTESYESTTASPVTYVHNVKLTGLTANTTYHYRVKQGGSTSADYTFKTAVTAGTNFRFAWLADTRTGTSIHDAIATRIKNANPAFSLYGGDLCYDSTYTKFKNEFFRPNELSLISKVPFFNAVGNHETWGTNTKAFTQAPTSSSGTQDYYSFDYGDMHVLVLNTQISYSAGSAQYNFAQSDLSSTTKPWKIVIAHKPAYCSGGHGEDSGMKALAINVFEPNKVDMVLGGHSHFYQHNIVNGIHHMVLGGGGAPLSTPTTASYTVKSVQDYNYAIADMTPTSMHMVVYNNNGTVLDTIDFTKGGGTGTTKSFQDGVYPTSTYAGTRDTQILESAATTNYGSGTSINADGDEPAASSKDAYALLKWDVSSIPVGSTIDSASITLNVTNASAGQAYELYELKKNWSESSATWNLYTTGTNWEIAGAKGSTDKGSTVVGTIAPSAAGKYNITLNSSGLALVKKWVDTPSSNYGLIIADSTNSDGIDFSSSENTTTGNRPLLKVTYH